MERIGAPTRHENHGPIAIDRQRVHCPVDVVLTVMGGRWKPSILWFLTRSDRPLRFNELRRAMPAISERMLSRQLRDLENHGIVYRDVYAVVPPRVEYGLTARGRSISPILHDMCTWGKMQSVSAAETPSPKK